MLSRSYIIFETVRDKKYWFNIVFGTYILTKMILVRTYVHIRDL